MEPIGFRKLVPHVEVEAEVAALGQDELRRDIPGKNAARIRRHHRPDGVWIALVVGGFIVAGRGVLSS